MAHSKDKLEELEKKAILWWPPHLNDANANLSIIPELIRTQDEFLKILSLSKKSPWQVFDLILATEFPANLFLKHLSVLADYGGEPIQRLGRSFSDIFEKSDDGFLMTFFWESTEFGYIFKKLPMKGLGSKKLFIDGKGLLEPRPLSDIYKDLIILLMFGSTSTVSECAALSSCEIGTLLGKADLLEEYVKQRYINVSRITGGATANSLGQLAQKEVVDYLKASLDKSFIITSNGTIQLEQYDKSGGMPFDIVVEHGNNKAGIEVSFQVTTNSTIERKSGQSADRMNLMHANGYKIAYVLDGAGNFQRKSALSTICSNSDCVVAFSNEQFDILAAWLRESL